MSSKIFLPSTYTNYSGEIRYKRIGLSLLAMNLVIILYITLQREIGHNFIVSSTLSSLGIRVTKEALRDGRIFEKRRECSTTSKTSNLITDQHVWKNFSMKPSIPRYLPFDISMEAFSTSSRVIGLRRASFCSCETLFGMFLVILFMESSLSYKGSINKLEK